MITSSDVAVSVITNVGAEHLAALGGSLESIAAAKSGIIKERRPVKWFLMHFSVYYNFQNYIVELYTHTHACIMVG